ncbi:MAG TPA: serine/threonine-protein kinase [Myxococcota bacterium]
MSRINDRFRILRPLAQGGMGDLFLADDGAAVRGDRAVLKMLRDDLDDAGAVARFEHEIEVLRTVQHRLIPRWLADGHWQGKRFVALAHVDGVALSDVMMALTRPLSPLVSVSLCIDVLHALDRAHTLTADDGAPLNLVHRDVSPHNIIVDDNGRGHLIDFGVSVDDRFADSTAGCLVGKVAYMAPEQAAGFALDARADQFAVGVVLWELLMSRRLFRADSEQRTWRNVVECNVPELIGVVDPVADVVTRMLRPDRTSRFASCQAAADALRLASRSLPSIDAATIAGVVHDARQRRARPPLERTAVLPA